MNASTTGSDKLVALLRSGDPIGGGQDGVHAKEVVRSIHDLDDPGLADEFVDQLGCDLQDDSCPVKVQSLGRTITRWRWPRGPSVSTRPGSF